MTWHFFLTLSSLYFESCCPVGLQELWSSFNICIEKTKYLVFGNRGWVFLLRLVIHQKGKHYCHRNNFLVSDDLITCNRWNLSLESRK